MNVWIQSHTESRAPAHPLGHSVQALFAWTCVPFLLLALGSGIARATTPGTHGSAMSISATQVQKLTANDPAKAFALVDKVDARHLPTGVASVSHVEGIEQANAKQPASITAGASSAKTTSFLGNTSFLGKPSVVAEPPPENGSTHYAIAYRGTYLVYSSERAADFHGTMVYRGSSGNILGHIYISAYWTLCCTYGSSLHAYSNVHFSHEAQTVMVYGGMRNGYPGSIYGGTTTWHTCATGTMHYLYAYHTYYAPGCYGYDREFTYHAHELLVQWNRLTTPGLWWHLRLYSPSVKRYGNYYYFMGATEVPGRNGYWYDQGHVVKWLTYDGGGTH